MTISPSRSPSWNSSQNRGVAAPAGGIARTTLRVGPLELDLIERTAKRGDRVIVCCRASFACLNI